jgi:hypothetical protein
MSEDLSGVLDSSLIWDQDGHLTDIAQSAIVDAESSLLPRAACEHAETCEQCMRSIGQLAQLSLEIEGALLGLQAQPLTAATPARAARGWPITELCAALLLALLGQLPTLKAFNPAGIRHTLGDVLHVSARVLQHIAGTSFGASLPFIAAPLLVGLAFLARRGLAPKLVEQSSR